MALIELRDVTKTYHRDRIEIPVLDRMTIAVEAGDFVGLMGPSGSGKSTLLNLLAGIDRPTRGTIRIGDTEISGLSERALAAWRARHIGFIFQLYNLIPVLTAFENVELPLLLTHLSKKQRRDHVMTALDIVGLADRSAHYPRQLSGGQEQRVAIARAIVTDPTLLLADEPTGDLDAKSAAEVLTLLQRLNQEYKKTIVMVTHDPHAAERATHVLHLEKGTLVRTRQKVEMKFFSLVLKSARRNLRRTTLTVISVAIAVFLFASLRAVLDGFHAAAEASSSTRIVTIRSTSMIFSMPTSHAGTIAATPGVRDVTWASWFGGIYKDPKNFFGQIAIDPESYLRMYPEIGLHAGGEAGVSRRSHRLHRRRRAGEALRLEGRRPARPEGRHPAVRAAGFHVHRSAASTTRASNAVDNQTLLFHWKYLDERSLVKSQVGWFVSEIDNPDQAASVATAIDTKFENTPYETKTDTEKAFQSSFASMFGNLDLLLGSIALAVVITTLFVAGNTMAMSVRERTTEIAVMRTLGFPSRTIFLLIAGEGLLMSLVGGVDRRGAGAPLVNGDVIGGGVHPGVRRQRPERRHRPAAERRHRHRRRPHSGDDGVAAEDRGRAQAGRVGDGAHPLRTTSARCSSARGPRR